MITLTITVANGMWTVGATNEGGIDIADEKALEMLTESLGHPENDIHRSARALLVQIRREKERNQRL
jgi:hypothetical protein